MDKTNSLDNPNSLASRLYNVVENICNIARTPYRRINTSYAIVHKNDVYAIARMITDIIKDIQQQPCICSNCELYKHNMDVNIAHETIDRIMRYANDPNFCVTKDEAENLLSLFDQIYSEKTTRGTKDDRR